jgi:hypothetical protein
MNLEKELYEELVFVRLHQLYKDTFIIHERDRTQGRRIIHYSLNSDSVYREEKF